MNQGERNEVIRVIESMAGLLFWELRVNFMPGMVYVTTNPRFQICNFMALDHKLKIGHDGHSHSECKHWSDVVHCWFMREVMPILVQSGLELKALDPKRAMNYLEYEIQHAV